VLFAALVPALADSVGACWPHEGPAWVASFGTPLADAVFAARWAGAPAFGAAVLEDASPALS